MRDATPTATIRSPIVEFFAIVPVLALLESNTPENPPMKKVS
jgi:hypothetical protein